MADSCGLSESGWIERGREGEGNVFWGPGLEGFHWLEFLASEGCIFGR